MSFALPQVLSYHQALLRCSARGDAVVAAPGALMPPAAAAVLALVLAGVGWLIMLGCTPHVAVATVAASGVVAAELRLRLS
ncbi:hypothetical protein GCM10023336_07580 [Streptomyces similanensis]|uniref:Uncharacterized protein n=1 Tax=Streptomyces similanensis TaxID=1274988 RepID=A0ABP9JUV5_9ACTN